jgi:hypothetical protein
LRHWRPPNPKPQPPQPKTERPSSYAATLDGSKTLYHFPDFFLAMGIFGWQVKRFTTFRIF